MGFSSGKSLTCEMKRQKKVQRDISGWAVSRWPWCCDAGWLLVHLFGWFRDEDQRISSTHLPSSVTAWALMGGVACSWSCQPGHNTCHLSLVCPLTVTHKLSCLLCLHCVESGRPWRRAPLPAEIFSLLQGVIKSSRDHLLA